MKTTITNDELLTWMVVCLEAKFREIRVVIDTSEVVVGGVGL